MKALARTKSGCNALLRLCLVCRMLHKKFRLLLENKKLDGMRLARAHKDRRSQLWGLFQGRGLKPLHRQGWLMVLLDEGEHYGPKDNCATRCFKPLVYDKKVFPCEFYLFGKSVESTKIYGLCALCSGKDKSGKLNVRNVDICAPLSESLPLIIRERLSNHMNEEGEDDGIYDWPEALTVKGFEVRLEGCRVRRIHAEKKTSLIMIRGELTTEDFMYALCERHDKRETVRETFRREYNEEGEEINGQPVPCFTRETLNLLFLKDCKGASFREVCIDGYRMEIQSAEILFRLCDFNNVGYFEDVLNFQHPGEYNYDSEDSDDNNAGNIDRRSWAAAQQCTFKGREKYDQIVYEDVAFEHNVEDIRGFFVESPPSKRQRTDAS